MVLADAALDDRFRGDRYIARARPRSILCVPMVHQGRLSGVMCLENDAATNVFDPARVELIQFLAAQAAIAIENATLYQELERRLIDMSRHAGRADVATSILHNVGNVLLNLLSNAMREVSDRGIRLHCGPPTGASSSASSHGVGIPAENLDRIFNFGFTTKEEGHGSGLHSCANAAAEIGGTLTCLSEGVGRGAAFTLTFALVPAGAPRSAAG